MDIKLTEEQMSVVKSMVRMSEAFANQLLHIVQNHGLDKIDGCDITIQVSPKYQSISKLVAIGIRETEFGHAEFVRGVNDDYWRMWGKCSEKYESLFEDEAERAGRKVFKKAEKPLPPDGLWIGDPRNDCPVDCRWEWDVNDSLS